MRKVYLNVLFFSIVFLVTFFNTTTVSSANNLTVGTKYVYLVKSYHLDAKVGSSEKKYDAFKIAGSEEISPGTNDANFTITYLGSNSSAVTYEFSKNNFKFSKTIVSSDKFIIFNSSQELLTSPPPITDLNSVVYSNDIAYSGFPMILPVVGKNDSLWNTLYNGALKDNSKSINQNGTSVSINIGSQITSDQFIVNININSNINSKSETSVLKLFVNFIYELKTGMLLGYKSMLAINQVLNGHISYIDLNTEFTRQDYSFQGSVGSYELLSVVSAFFVMVVIGKILKKNKRLI